MSCVPVASGGNRTARPAVLRWLLLGCTLLGLAAMHTLGHTGHAMAMPDPPATHPQTTATMLAAHATHTAAPIGYPCLSGCAHVAGGGPAGGDPSSWSVCLAILTALAVAVLLGWLSRAATQRGATNRPTRPLAITCRAPPVAGVGLRLADLAVLRG
jgi:hypothetical protein